jgi:hypothetical protein
VAWILCKHHIGKSYALFKQYFRFCFVMKPIPPICFSSHLVEYF